MSPESKKRTGDRLNALRKLVDHLIRKRPPQ
jgi:hypothetical protein